MRIAFVNPPQPYLVNPGEYRPLGLEYLLASVRTHCDWVDAELLDLSAASEDEAVDALKGYDICAYTATTLDYERVCRIAQRARDLYNGMQIVGGPHITVGSPGLFVWDATFKGEGEETIAQFLKDIRDGIAWMGTEYVGSRIARLDLLPWPERDGLGTGTATIMGSRGCKHRCKFCASQGIWGNAVYRRDPRMVAAEIRHIHRRHGTEHFAIFDEDLMASRGWLVELCEAIEPLGITWRAQARVNHVTEELAAMMRDAGCTMLDLGVESFDDKVLSKLGKHAMCATNVRAIKAAHAVGLPTGLFVMIGTPGETYGHTVDENLYWLRDMLNGQYQELRLYIFMPLPGSPIYARPEEFGITIVSRDFERYNRHLHRRDADGGMAAAWSPIRIDGMTHEQQMANIARMIAFAEERQGVPA
ncbi:MAG: B12-binding domain-containing radical SAM protein [Planctomycetota bacterium]